MTSPFSRLDARMRRLPDLLLLAIGLALIAGIAVLKVTWARDTPIVDFFLIPVAGVGWLTRSRFCGCVAVCTAAAVSGLLAVAVQEAPLGASLAAAAARLVLYMIVLSLLRAMRRMQTERDVEAHTDHQTGAANARCFRVQADAELARSRRYGHGLSVLYLDVDDFKEINDRYGHTAGDQILLAVSHVMRCSVRSCDLVARLGGDEFAVLMPETNRFSAGSVAKRVQDELARVTTPDGDPVHYSIGMATLVDPRQSVDEVLHAADHLMYRAKEKGKDRIETAQLSGLGAVAITR